MTEWRSETRNASLPLSMPMANYYNLICVGTSMKQLRNKSNAYALLVRFACVRIVPANKMFSILFYSLILLLINLYHNKLPKTKKPILQCINSQQIIALTSLNIKSQGCKIKK